MTMCRTLLLHREAFSAIIAFAVFLLPAISGHACDVPVYQWALEQWEADPYQVIIFTERELDTQSRALIDTLSAAGAAEGDSANVAVRVLDVTTAFDEPT